MFGSLLPVRQSAWALPTAATYSSAQAFDIIYTLVFSCAELKAWPPLHPLYSDPAVRMEHPVRPQRGDGGVGRAGGGHFPSPERPQSLNTKCTVIFFCFVKVRKGFQQNQLPSFGNGAISITHTQIIAHPPSREATLV